MSHVGKPRTVLAVMLMLATGLFAYAVLHERSLIGSGHGETVTQLAHESAATRAGETPAKRASETAATRSTETPSQRASETAPTGGSETSAERSGETAAKRAKRDPGDDSQ